MTVMIDLTDVEEARLAAAARRAGVAPAVLLKQIVGSLPAPDVVSPVRQTSGERPPLRGYGMFAHVPGGSEEYAREKQAEIAREERHPD